MKPMASAALPPLAPSRCQADETGRHRWRNVRETLERALSLNGRIAASVRLVAMRWIDEETCAFFQLGERRRYQKHAVVIDPDCEAGRMKLGMIQ
jgi:hypothetical protein